MPVTDRAVFFDKDGTLVENVPYNVDPHQVRLTAGARAAIRTLTAAGYRIFVVSNQSGIARGYFPTSALDTVSQRVRELLGDVGDAIEEFYWCPHHPGGVVPAFAIECDCRKPRGGLLRRAAAEHHLDLPACWMVGDILDDVEAAHDAGVRAVLFDSGGETRWEVTKARAPDVLVNSLEEAARAIVLGDAVTAALEAGGVAWQR